MAVTRRRGRKPIRKQAKNTATLQPNRQNLNRTYARPYKAPKHQTGGAHSNAIPQAAGRAGRATGRALTQVGRGGNSATGRFVGAVGRLGRGVGAAYQGPKFGLGSGTSGDALRREARGKANSRFQGNRPRGRQTDAPVKGKTPKAPVRDRTPNTDRTRRRRTETTDRGPRHAPPGSGRRAEAAKVYKQQQWLIDRGYKVTKDGRWGPQTASAWKAAHTGVSSKAWNGGSPKANRTSRPSVRPQGLAAPGPGRPPGARTRPAPGKNPPGRPRIGAPRLGAGIIDGPIAGGYQSNPARPGPVNENAEQFPGMAGGMAGFGAGGGMPDFSQLLPRIPTWEEIVGEGEPDPSQQGMDLSGVGAPEFEYIDPNHYRQMQGGGMGGDGEVEPPPNFNPANYEDPTKVRQTTQSANDLAYIALTTGQDPRQFFNNGSPWAQKGLAVYERLAAQAGGGGSMGYGQPSQTITPTKYGTKVSTGSTSGMVSNMLKDTKQAADSYRLTAGNNQTNYGKYLQNYETFQKLHQANQMFGGDVVEQHLKNQGLRIDNFNKYLGVVNTSLDNLLDMQQYWQRGQEAPAEIAYKQGRATNMGIRNQAGIMGLGLLGKKGAKLDADITGSITRSRATAARAEAYVRSSGLRDQATAMKMVQGGRAAGLKEAKMIADIKRVNALTKKYNKGGMGGSSGGLRTKDIMGTLQAGIAGPRGNLTMNPDRALDYLRDMSRTLATGMPKSEQNRIGKMALNIFTQVFNKSRRGGQWKQWKWNPSTGTLIPPR